MCTAGSARQHLQVRQDLYGSIVGTAESVGSIWQDMHCRMCMCTTGPARQHLQVWQNRYSRICIAASAGTAGSVWQHVHGSICTTGSDRQHLQVQQNRYGTICTAGSVRQDLYTGWREHAPSSQCDDVFVFSITSQLHTLM